MAQLQLEVFGNLSASDLSETAQDYLAVGLRRHELNALRFVSKCQSPIEQLLGMALWFEFVIPEDYVLVEMQYPVRAGGKNYHLDFAIIHDQQHIPEKDRCLIAIECDGHDYHERTKEQAKHDKQRDRDLQLAGWHVLRFTGSEIHNNPLKCVREVNELYRQLAGNSLREELEGEI